MFRLVGTMWSDLFLFHFLRTVGSRHDAGAALVLEPVALTSDLNDGRVMQDPVEHGGSEHSVARERLVPTAECEIGGEDQRASFVTPRDHLEEQIGLLASERQIADLIDDQQLRCRDPPMHPLFHPALPIAASIAMTRSAAVVKRTFQLFC